MRSRVSNGVGFLVGRLGCQCAAAHRAYLAMRKGVSVGGTGRPRETRNSLKSNAAGRELPSVLLA